MKEALDEQMMRRCLELATLAKGRTTPNPLVGAVVLNSSGEVAGEGYHAKAGEPHAEVVALRQAGDSARDGTLFVNLEPCCHFGRTPPCTKLLIESGIRRVVVGILDPNPKVLGQGIAALQEVGIQVDHLPLSNECEDLNRAFIKQMKTGLPWVSLKLASTLDGRIADREKQSRWITGSISRQYVHKLRNEHDCILVGSGTVITDDPQLDVREIENGRNPHRAVLDPHLSVQPSAKICKHIESSDTWTTIFCHPEFLNQQSAFPTAVRLVAIDGSPNKTSMDMNRYLEIEQLKGVLRWFTANQIQSVLCEGGSVLAGALLEFNLVDELFWFLAPKLAVDKEAKAALCGQNRSSVSEFKNLMQVEYLQLASDMLVKGRFDNSHY